MTLENRIKCEEQLILEGFKKKNNLYTHGSETYIKKDNWYYAQIEKPKRKERYYLQI